MSQSTEASFTNKRFVSGEPGSRRPACRHGTVLGQDPNKIYEPVWGVIGNLGDSQCYVGVTQKVDAIQKALAGRIASDDLPCGSSRRPTRSAFPTAS